MLVYRSNNQTEEPHPTLATAAKPSSSLWPVSGVKKTATTTTDDAV
jgi:hypothetical protein